MGRPPSMRANEERFLADPNRLAAAIAAEWITEWKKENPRRYKVKQADGTKKTLYDAGVDAAIEQIKNWGMEFPGGRTPNAEAVKELLRQVRTDWPPDDGSPHK